MKVYKVEKLVTEYLTSDTDTKIIAKTVGVSPATIDRLRDENHSLDNAHFGTIKKLYIAAKAEKREKKKGKNKKIKKEPS